MTLPGREFRMTQGVFGCAACERFTSDEVLFVTDHGEGKWGIGDSETCEFQPTSETQGRDLRLILREMWVRHH